MAVKIESGDWVLTSTKLGYETYRPRLVESGTNAGRVRKLDLKSHTTITDALRRLEHCVVHDQEIETWEQLKAAYARFHREVGNFFLLSVEMD